MRLPENHNSLGCKQPPGLDVNQSPNVQDMFLLLPGLISCAGVTGGVGVTCHAHTTSIYITPCVVNPLWIYQHMSSQKQRCTCTCSFWGHIDTHHNPLCCISCVVQSYVRTRTIKYEMPKKPTGASTALFLARHGLTEVS